jgi:hypothetical protein
VRLADAGRAKDQDVFGLRQKLAGGEFAHETLIDRRLEFEIEFVEASSLSGSVRSWVPSREGHQNLRAVAENGHVLQQFIRGQREDVPN